MMRRALSQVTASMVSMVGIGGTKLVRRKYRIRALPETDARSFARMTAAGSDGRPTSGRVHLDAVNSRPTGALPASRAASSGRHPPA